MNRELKEAEKKFDSLNAVSRIGRDMEQAGQDAELASGRRGRELVAQVGAILGRDPLDAEARVRHPQIDLERRLPADVDGEARARLEACVRERFAGDGEGAPLGHAAQIGVVRRAGGRRRATGDRSGAEAGQPEESGERSRRLREATPRGSAGRSHSRVMG